MKGLIPSYAGENSVSGNGEDFNKKTSYVILILTIEKKINFKKKTRFEVSFLFMVN